MKCHLSVSKFVLFLAISLVSLPTQAAELYHPLPERSSAIRAAIEKSRALIRAGQEDRKIPGVSVAVAVNGQVIWSEGLGWADLEQKIVVSPLARFRIGSVSKMFCAVAVAALVEQGRLDLDAPVQQYVPYFPEKRWPITARQLAGHMAGIRHYRDEDYSGPLAGAPHFTSVRDGLAIFAGNPLEFQPGTKYQYSSYGFNLLSAVVEGAAGESYLDAVNRLVTEPLGLLATGADHPYYILPNRSRFYWLSENDGPLNARFIDSSYKWAGGGFLSTPDDLVHFASALLQPGFLRAETLKLMFTPRQLANGESTGVGIGWRVDRDEQNRRRFHHGGTILGGGAILLALRDEKVAVAIVTNQLPRFSNDEAGQIAAWFAEAYGNNQNGSYSQ